MAELFEATRSYSGNVLPPLSTDGTSDDSAQDAVAQCIRLRYRCGEFEEGVMLSPHATMMSLLDQRGVEFSAELMGLAERFRRWRDAVERRR